MNLFFSLHRLNNALWDLLLVVPFVYISLFSRSLRSLRLFYIFTMLSSSSTEGKGIKDFFTVFSFLRALFLIFYALNHLYQYPKCRENTRYHRSCPSFPFRLLPFVSLGPFHRLVIYKLRNLSGTLSDYWTKR